MFKEMSFLEEGIAIVSWKAADKMYEDVRQLYHRKHGKQSLTKANIRLLQIVSSIQPPHELS